MIKASTVVSYHKAHETYARQGRTVSWTAAAYPAGHEKAALRSPQGRRSLRSEGLFAPAYGFSRAAIDRFLNRALGRPSGVLDHGDVVVPHFKDLWAGLGASAAAGA